jgi:23S rRNA (guanosine2251-2'-O)-methyltransferase
MREWICGRNPVYEVLAVNRRSISRLMVAEGAQPKGRLAEILALCSAQGIPVERVSRTRLDGYGSGHQGVALEAGPYPYSSLNEIIDNLKGQQEMALVLILDMIQDPQNLGTLLRTAESVGVNGVLLPLRRAATVTPAVVQSSSGASEYLQIARANIAQAIAQLKEAGMWVIGLEGRAEALPPAQVRLDVPLALVVGSEGAGMRRLVRESCDMLMGLPMRGKVGSLNAAVAGSVALYMAWQARGDYMA